jgi:hypothetical protein
MGKAWMVMVAAVLGGHGFVGLFIEGSHMLGVLNVDFFLDVLYLLSAATLLVAGTRQLGAGAIRATLAAFGGLYTLMGVLSLLDPRLGGLAPTGFTVVVRRSGVRPGGRAPCRAAVGGRARPGCPGSARAPGTRLTPTCRR